MNTVQDRWISPAKASDISCGLWSAYQIKQAIDRAIADPASKLVSGVHYAILSNPIKPRYKVDWDALRDVI